MYLIWKLHFLGVDKGIVHFAVTIISGRNGRLKNFGKSGYFFKKLKVFSKCQRRLLSPQTTYRDLPPLVRKLILSAMWSIQIDFSHLKISGRNGRLKKKREIWKIKKSKIFFSKFRFLKKSPDFPKFLNRPFRPLIIVTAKCAIPLLTPKKCSFHMRYGTLLY